MLVSAAAAQWGVPSGECITRNHQVVHQPTGRTLDYGALVPAAAKLTVPKGEVADASRIARRGSSSARTPSIYDQKDIVTGKAQFGLDIFRDGMVHASIEHPPVLGGTVRSVDDTAARKVRGVQQTVTLDTFKPPHLFQPLGGVAVIGDNTWAVLKGRRALKVEWNDGPHAAFESERVQEGAAVDGRRSPARSSATSATSTPSSPRAARCSRPPTSRRWPRTPRWSRRRRWPTSRTARRSCGRRRRIRRRCRTRWPRRSASTRRTSTCHVTLLGGGFGRKSKPDYCAEAAVLSKRLGKPVKVVWTREDDLRFDYYHTTAAVYHKAGGRRPRQADGVAAALGVPADRLDVRAGRARAAQLRARSRADRPAVRHRQHPRRERPGRRARAHRLVPLGQQHLPRVRRAQLRRRDGARGRPRPARVHARHARPGQGARPEGAGREVLELRRAASTSIRSTRGGCAACWRLPASGRAGRSARRAAAAAWASPRTAASTATSPSVVEVEVDGRGGVKVPAVHMVVDAGVIVNPDRVRSQMEGSAVMARRLRADRRRSPPSTGRIQQTNFHQFQVARMNDAPLQVHVHLVESDALPTGVGEPGLPPVARGVRQRHLRGDRQARPRAAAVEDEAGVDWAEGRRG